MVDVFGGQGGAKTRRGPRGPRGPKGLRGYAGSIHDMCMWSPMALITNMRLYDESGYFSIENADRDLKIKNKHIVAWMNKTGGKGNLVAKAPSPGYAQVKPNCFALMFNNSRYESATISALPTIKGYCGFLCITFKVEEDGEQVLISNFNGDEENDYCEILVTGTEIRLHLHSEDEIIQHNCTEWTTLYVSCNSDRSTSFFGYTINNKHVGSFISPSKDLNEIGIVVGARYDASSPMTGQILAMEFYCTHQPIQFPDDLKKIVNRCHMEKHP